MLRLKEIITRCLVVIRIEMTSDDLEKGIKEIELVLLVLWLLLFVRVLIEK